MSTDLAEIRSDYLLGKLSREDLSADPIEQFNRWLDEAIHSGLREPTAMSLATAGADGRPLLRTVLLKGVDPRGFVFFTNLESRKARQLAKIRTPPCSSPGWPWSVRSSSPARPPGSPPLRFSNTSSAVHATANSPPGLRVRAASSPHARSSRWNGST